MLLRILLVTGLCMTCAHGRDLTVKLGVKQFNLNFTPAAVIFKAHDLKINLTEKKCNSALLKRFNSELSAALKRIYRKKQPISGGLELKLDGEVFHESRHSPAGSYISTLPDEIRRLKLEESELCKK